MNDAKWIVIAVCLWFILSSAGLLLPIFLGLVFFLLVAPIVSGYVAARSAKTISIVVVSVITTVLAAAIGSATMGSVPPELQKKVTGIDLTPGTLILAWVFLNASLTLITGYVRFKYHRRGDES